MTYLDGCIFAESKGYIVKDFSSPLKSFSVVVDDTYAIAINQSTIDCKEAKTVLFHELGHCATGSFYNEYSPCDVRKRHENRADKWAIKKLIQEDELKEAISNGYTDLWELAEYFDVTEEFMRKAICWYTHGNLETELYF